MSKEQKEVLEMLLSEFLTVKQIANRRKTSVQAVYKIVNKLQQKGYVDKSILNFKVLSRRPLKKKLKYDIPRIRLHGIEFNIKIIYSTPKYREFKENKTLINISDSTIRLYKNSIEVYGKQSFIGDTARECFHYALDWYRNVFLKIQRKLGITILKQGVGNIRIVKSHISETNNEIAKDYNISGRKLNVRDDKGVLWLIIDDSHNLKELECVNNATNIQDMDDIIKPFLNDLRQNPLILSRKFEKLEKDIKAIKDYFGIDKTTKDNYIM